MVAVDLCWLSPVVQSSFNPRAPGSQGNGLRAVHMWQHSDDGSPSRTRDAEVLPKPSWGMPGPCETVIQLNDQN